MNKYFPLILSFSIHIIFFIITILTFPTKTVVEDEEIIRVELVFKKEEKSVENRNFIGKNVDIIDNSSSVAISVEKPKRDSYIEQVTNNEPDLVLLNRSDIKTEEEDSLEFNRVEFENSLLDLMPVFELEEDSSNDSLNISWDGEKREVVSNSHIDFSSFPKESFTGVGVRVEFMVNTVGEVFNVNIIPPGSGSIDFDILIKQYVLKFRFKEDKETSRGEVLIVYKK